jgi:hypothetical protein
MTFHMMNEQDKALWIAVYAALCGTDARDRATLADEAVLVFRDRCKNGIEVKTR